jgi:hypothetical protein
MPKHLYEEALADVKKVKEVAEDNAKRAVLEAVTPRIREFIDRALLGEPGDEESDFAPSGVEGPGSPPLGPEMGASDSLVDPTAGVPAGSITPPDSEGKVTLDIDALCSEEPGTPVAPPQFGAAVPAPEETEYEISLESIETLQPVINAATKRPAMSNKDIVANLNNLAENVSLFKKAGKAIRSTSAYHQQITQMISHVEDMYVYVQERVADPTKKVSYETMLEASFKDLNKLQEPLTMSKKTTKGQTMNEADVTLKLTGLPDDIDLDTVGVDLITGEDEEGEGDDFGGDDAGGDDLDFGGDQMGGQQMGGEEQQMETRNLSDDTIVEIDEKMLRREIARMRNIRENHTGTGGSETKADSWGNGADHFDAFGGGKADGEALDAEIVDKSPSPGALPLGEADGEDLEEADDLDEGDDLEEGDDLDEADFMPEAVDGPGHGGNQTMPTNKESRHPGETLGQARTEGLRRLAFEKKLQERAKARASALKKEAASAKSSRNASRFNEAKKEYAVVAKRFNESVTRTKKITQFVASATKRLQEARSNTGTARPAENTAENATLRKKLAETNLFNAKLLFTNKLLQNDQLTARQKVQVIKQIDTAKTVREAKLVYESLANTLASTSKSVNEGADRKVMGSGSRATRPASTQTLNEGYEAERWAQLAGITKR